MSLINPTWFETKTPRQQVTIVIAALLILVGVIAALVYVFGGGHAKEDRLKGNINVAIGENAVVANLVANQAGVVKNAEINTNRADNALRNSIAKPSNQFDGNRANDRFCRNFPDDPSCKPR